MNAEVSVGQVWRDAAGARLVIHQRASLPGMWSARGTDGGEFVIGVDTLRAYYTIEVERD